jgi:hypothetical protein
LPSPVVSRISSTYVGNYPPLSIQKLPKKICASSGSSRGYKIKTGHSAYGAREVLKEKALGNNESSLFMVHLSKWMTFCKLLFHGIEYIQGLGCDATVKRLKIYLIQRVLISPLNRLVFNPFP